MRKYKAKNGATQFMPSIEEAQEMAECQEGLCVYTQTLFYNHPELKP